MKILFKSSFAKGARILGPWLAILDNFYILDLFFALRGCFRVTVSDSDGNVSVKTIVENREELFRGKRVFSKEPDTIQWINTWVKPGDTLFDIGANIGVFSLYAAMQVSGVRVFSFEPMAANYAKLNENIRLNGLDESITAFPIALNDRDSFASFNVQNIHSAASGNQYNSDRDDMGQQFTPVFRQGCIGLTLDTLVYRIGFPVPNHIKIDVDGNDALVIGGGERVLADQAVKTLLMELAVGEKVHPQLDQASRRVMELLKGKGFTLRGSFIIGEDESLKNYLFVRDGV